MLYYDVMEMDISVRAKFLYSLAASFTEDGKALTMSNALLAKYLSCTTRSVTATIKELEDEKLIKVTIEHNMDRSIISRGVENISRGVRKKQHKGVENISNNNISGDKINNNNTLESEFDLFYSAYPRKMKPKDAEKAWKSVHKDLPPIEELLTILEKHITSWKDREMRHIPYPATWLRGHEWKGEIEELKKKGFKEVLQAESDHGHCGECGEYDRHTINGICDECRKKVGK